MRNKKHIESSESFYDSVASDYNSSLTDTDEKARKVVSSLFKKNVREGNVLDFGGGTGLDTSWMLENKYRIFFLEPSEGMRAQAKKNARSAGNPIFIESRTELRSWSETNLPMDEKVRGVLANFAVLNCIGHPAIFFSGIRLLLDEHGCVVVTVIDPRFRPMAKVYSIFAAIRLSVSGRLEVLNRHKGIYHRTFIHSVNSLRKHAAKYFNLESCVPIPDSGFVTLIFRLK